MNLKIVFAILAIIVIIALVIFTGGLLLPIALPLITYALEYGGIIEK